MRTDEADRNEPVAPTGQAGTGKSAEHHSVYCPNCSERLTERKCKLVCLRCGYYLSCADYY